MKKVVRISTRYKAISQDGTSFRFCMVGRSVKVLSFDFLCDSVKPYFYEVSKNEFRDTQYVSRISHITGFCNFIIRFYPEFFGQVPKLSDF